MQVLDNQFQPVYPTAKPQHLLSLLPLSLLSQMASYAPTHVNLFAMTPLQMPQVPRPQTPSVGTPIRVHANPNKPPMEATYQGFSVFANVRTLCTQHRELKLTTPNQGTVFWVVRPAGQEENVSIPAHFCQV